MGQIENYLDDILEVLEEGGGGGGGTSVVPLSVTENGTYTASQGTAYSPVTVNVPQSGVEVESLSVTENGRYDAPEGKAYSPVTVEVIPNLGQAEILSNGTYYASALGLDGFSEVNVTVPEPLPPSLLSKTITENGSYTAASEGYDGYSDVTVVVPQDELPIRLAKVMFTEYTTSSQEVTIDAPYYSQPTNRVDTTINLIIPAGASGSRFEAPIIVANGDGTRTIIKLTSGNVKFGAASGNVTKATNQMAYVYGDGEIELREV